MPLMHFIYSSGNVLVSFQWAMGRVYVVMFFLEVSKKYVVWNMSKAVILRHTSYYISQNLK